MKLIRSFTLECWIFILLFKYFIGIYPSSLSLSSSVRLVNLLLFPPRKSFILSERRRKFNWGWKTSECFPSWVNWELTFILFLPSHFSLVCFLRSRSMPGSVLLLSPVTIHSVILSSTFWDHNLLFLFLYQSLSSSLYIPISILLHFGLLLPFFSSPALKTSAPQTLRCTQSPEDFVDIQVLI